MNSCSMRAMKDVCIECWLRKKRGRGTRKPGRHEGGQTESEEGKAPHQSFTLARDSAGWVAVAIGDRSYWTVAPPPMRAVFSFQPCRPVDS